MNYLIPLAAGFFTAIFVTGFSKLSKIEKVLFSVMTMLMLVLFPMLKGTDSIYKAAAGFLCFFAALITGLVFRKQFTKLYSRLMNRPGARKATQNDPGEHKEDPLTDEEEEEMKKQQKIITVLCVVLILYMIISTFCICKLNSKINTLYEITMERDK